MQQAGRVVLAARWGNPGRATRFGCGRAKHASLFAYADHGWTNDAGTGVTRSTGMQSTVVFDQCPSRSGKQPPSSDTGRAH